MSALERLGLSPQPLPPTVSSEQSQTRDTFGFKWKLRDSYESPAMKEHARDWLFRKYCGGDPAVLDGWLREGRSPKIIVDAGVGSGFSALLFFGERLRGHNFLGVDISDAAWVAKQRFEEAGLPGDFLQADLCNLPLPDGSVDILFSEGVLHHTDSVENAVRALARKLRVGGRFLFYVYSKKAPIREFTDDHIREYLKGMSNEDAWEALKPLTNLGKALGDLNVEFDVPEDVPYLGIKKGRVNLQRFFYYVICKAFYVPTFTVEEMNHVNFDWFRPLNCHRSTPEEIRTYCERAGLSIENMVVEDSGITVVARRAQMA